MQRTLVVKLTNPDLDDREKDVIQAFDVDFISFSYVEAVQAQIKHDSQMFDIVCQNIKNDLGALDACINELRRCEQEGKELYAKFSMSFNFTKESDDEIQKKHDEVNVPTINFYNWA